VGTASTSTPPRRSIAARLGLTSVPRDELIRRYTQRGSKFVKIMGANVRSNHWLCQLVIPEMAERREVFDHVKELTTRIRQRSKR